MSVDLGVHSEQGRLGSGDDRPLTDQEYQLLQRLLSDPFSFPLPFKTWLVSYLSGSDLTLPIGAILGLSALLGISGAGGGTIGILPAGIILPYGGDTAPVGTKKCDGTSYLATDEPRLYAAIGTRYGGDGVHFNVPDGPGRTIVGLGTHADVNAANKNEGLAAAQRTPRHATSINDPGHAHGTSVSDPGHGHGVSDPGHKHGQHQSINKVEGTAGGPMLANSNVTNDDTTTSTTGISINGNGTGVSVGVSGNTTGISGGPGGGGRPVDTVPFFVANYIIVA